MRSDRIARALLGLYPHPWRERYGDEFLALIAESGLSWRGAIDIVRAGIAERARNVWTLAHYTGDPDDPLLMNRMPPRSWADVFVEGLTLTGIVAAVAVVLLVTAGIQPPAWSTGWWVYLRFWSSDWEPTSYLLRRSDRIVAKGFWVVAAMGVAALNLVAGVLLQTTGVPEIPPRPFIAIGATVSHAG